MKNITNGEIDLNVDDEDKVPEEYKFIRVPGGDMIDLVRQKNPNIETNYYIESTLSLTETSGRVRSPKYHKTI